MKEQIEIQTPNSCGIRYAEVLILQRNIVVSEMRKKTAEVN